MNRCFWILIALHGAATFVIAQADQPWLERIHRITREEFDATLEFWSGEHPDTLKIETLGKTVGGAEIPMLILTDPAVDDAEKQR